MTDHQMIHVKYVLTSTKYSNTILSSPRYCEPVDRALLPFLKYYSALPVAQTERKLVVIVGTFIVLLPCKAKL